MGNASRPPPASTGGGCGLKPRGAGGCRGAQGGCTGPRLDPGVAARGHRGVSHWKRTVTGWWQLIPPKAHRAAELAATLQCVKELHDQAVYSKTAMA